MNNIQLRTFSDFKYDFFTKILRGKEYYFEKFAQEEEFDKNDEKLAYAVRFYKDLIRLAYYEWKLLNDRQYGTLKMELISIEDMLANNFPRPIILSKKFIGFEPMLRSMKPIKKESKNVINVLRLGHILSLYRFLYTNRHMLRGIK